MTKKLNGKIALVTGGSRGIGAAIVRRLAEEGAQVAFTYSASKDAAEKLASEVGGRAYHADASDVAALPNLAQKVIDDFGRIDILVNNAGVLGEGLIGEIDMDEYHRIMRINVDAVFALTNEVAKTMPAGGRIVNISSILGQRAIMPGLSTYNTSKFAVVGQTRSWAHDLAPRGILVNAVLPGPIATDMNPENGEHGDAMRSIIPLGRFGQPQEVAAAVAFLAGPDSAFITGTVLPVDGGASA